MDRVTVGSHVDIKRSDGRIHGAVVSDVNKATSSVTVEWFEKGETKGKEIDLASILAINPHLATPTGGGVSSEEEAMEESPPKERRTLNNNTRKSVNGMNNGKSALPSVLKPPAVRVRTTMDTTKISHRNIPEEEENVAPAPQRNDYGKNAPAAAAAAAAATAAANRKSTTVQEIEKLKKGREDRRAQQEELKRHRDQLKSLDPGNPNWQFMNMINMYKEQLDFRPIKATDAIVDQRICVCVRKRPMNKKEDARKEIEVVTVPNKDHVIVHQPQTKVDLTKYLDNQKFRFDYAFDDSSSNELVYRFTAQPLVKTIFDQGFATCFAYGQTGSGKTHTMGGDFNGGKSQDCSRGIYALTARDVFKYLNNKEYKKENLYVACSFFEIYGGKVFDLLKNKAKLRVLEDGKKEVQVVGLQERTVNDEDEVLQLISRGTEVRTAGQTSANNNSSRSHAVFQILLRRKQSKKLFGKFSLIDLAGNERGVDTMSSDRQTRMEGAEINKSLLALKECIRAMGRNSAHLPFRASKLTLVLRDSFVGANARTCMIAMISPGMNSCEHSLNTLRYADRVKELGADDATTSPNDDGIGDYPMGDSPHESDDDLALLQSRNEDELSEDVYNFQLTINHLNDAEDHVHDEHQKLMEDMQNALKELQKMFKRTEKVDYDIDAYARDMAALLNTFPDGAALKEGVKKLQTEIAKEADVAARAQARSSKRTN